MKTAALILAVFNTLPLAVWVFIALPLAKLAASGLRGETPMSQFFGYGFVWGSLLFPILLILNHAFFIKNYRIGAYRPALLNQAYTLIYLVLILVYGILALR